MNVFVFQCLAHGQDINIFVSKDQGVEKAIVHHI